MTMSDTQTKRKLDETKEKWVVMWFHPSGDLTRTFKSEHGAREFAKSDDVAEWFPVLEHHVVTTEITYRNV